MKTCRFLLLASALLSLAFAPHRVRAQSGFDDDRVMIQGFYWESYRHGHPTQFPEYGEDSWYAIVAREAGRLREGRFDLIWLPPTAYAGERSAGYNPKAYFALGNSYGTEAEHLATLRALLAAGVEPVADIVINHRDGTHAWTDFSDPDWDTHAICREDEAFLNPDSEAFDLPLAERGNPEEIPAYAGHGGSTYAYPVFRDIDHTNETVRRDIVRYLRYLRSAGYRGWRYDMVHGFHARWIAVYNRATEPTFSVGEYDWSEQGGQRGWIWHSATTPDDLRTASNVFDFQTLFALENNKGNYRAWSDHGFGLMGDTTDGQPWKNRAVTFLENHDTGYRTNEDGTPQEHHEHDRFQNNWEVEQAYAYILTHPGIPCVYWKHYFDWGPDLRNKIQALINARKVADVHAGSTFHTQYNAHRNGVYAAYVEGRAGALYVRIGGNDEAWTPAHSNYRDYREYARGAGWKVWVGLPGNPPFAFAPQADPFPAPGEPHLPAPEEISDAMIAD